MLFSLRALVIWQDLVFPTEIVGKRTRCKIDGSKILKVQLDPKDQVRNISHDSYGRRPPNRQPFEHTLKPFDSSPMKSFVSLWNQRVFFFKGTVRVAGSEALLHLFAHHGVGLRVHVREWSTGASTDGSQLLESSASNNIRSLFNEHACSIPAF